MGLNVSAAYIGDIDNSINTDRNLLSWISGGLSGVCSATDFKATIVAGLHQIRIPAGKGFLVGRDLPASQGTYFVYSDGNDDLDLPAPEANDFYATIIIRVADPQYGVVTGTVGAYYEILSGTPGGSPVAISDVQIDALGIPGSWHRVANVLIHPSDAGEIPIGQVTDTRVVLEPLVAATKLISTTDLTPDTTGLAVGTVIVTYVNP